MQTKKFLSKSTVSVVIPVYNRARFLKRALISVLKQSILPKEIIIVDDGSSDNFDSVLNEFLTLTVPIKLLKLERNFGVSTARNRGIAHSKGEWIALLDSDDEWYSDKLELQLLKIEKVSNCKIVHGNEKWIKNHKPLNQKKKHKKYGGHIFENCIELCLISPSASIFKKSLWNELGGFDESFTVCEDYDFWLKATSLHDVGFIEKPIIIKYGGHDNQLSMTYKSMDYYRIIALKRILRIRRFDSETNRKIYLSIFNRSQILINGYKKYKNYKNINEIESLYLESKNYFKDCSEFQTQEARLDL